jgi:2-C-methyl-D-erythritol 4-phosphate cytidylyltransferase
VGIADEVNTRNIWAIVPAAGVGKRMQSAIPKQYLLLDNRPVIEHALHALLDSPHIYGLVVALGEHDEYWSDVTVPGTKPVVRTPGGPERAYSVLSALDTLFNIPEFDIDNDWVMVHDAVRPCLRQQDIDRLVKAVGDDINGGILAHPARDTIKQQQSINIQENYPATIDKTVDRTYLWHALTPQYFPARQLREALASILSSEQSSQVTDEASAMEMSGFSPYLVHGHEDNIKITRPDDLRIAGLFLMSISSRTD